MTKDYARALLRIIAVDLLAGFALGAFMAAASYLLATYLLGIERTTEFWWNLSVKVVMFGGITGVIAVIIHIKAFISLMRKNKD